MPTDIKQINFSEFHEIKDWLIKNGYKGNKLNWKLMRGLAYVIKEYFNKDFLDHLTWQELDEFHAKSPIHFLVLEISKTR